MHRKNVLANDFHLSQGSNKQRFLYNFVQFSIGNIFAFKLFIDIVVRLSMY